MGNLPRVHSLCRCISTLLGTAFRKECFVRSSAKAAWCSYSDTPARPLARASALLHNANFLLLAHSRLSHSDCCSQAPCQEGTANRNVMRSSRAAVTQLLVAAVLLQLASAVFGYNECSASGMEGFCNMLQAACNMHNDGCVAACATVDVFAVAPKGASQAMNQWIVVARWAVSKLCCMVQCPCTAPVGTYRGCTACACEQQNEKHGAGGVGGVIRRHDCHCGCDAALKRCHKLLLWEQSCG
eukprot:353222-Chlamydomonas_euryale.AAC.7